MVLDPCYAPGYRNFDVCFLLCCALESSYLGRLSAIKVQLELEFCTYTDGSDKYPLLEIGNSQKPRSFKNTVNLPTDYTPNSKAWMTAETFRDWLKKFHRKMKTQQQKLALVLDNCVAHPKNVVGLKPTEHFFLPPNTTSVLQLL